MGTSPLPQPSQPLWWVPGAILAVVGLAMVALGVYDHDNQALTTLGASIIASAGGFLVGKQSPTP